jgi:uncharacterized protein
MFALPQFAIRPSNYLISVPGDDPAEQILVSGLSGYADVVDGQTARWIDNNCKGAAPSSIFTKSYLLERGHLTTKSLQGERNYAKKKASNFFDQLRGKTGLYTIILSYDCNFRCTYCSQREVQSRGSKYLAPRITDEIMDAMFHHIETGPKQYSITLYGGEPFQSGNSKVIPRFFDWLKKQGKSVTCITNGFEIDQFPEVMNPELIGALQITLDGPAKTHDKKRILIGRKPTFWKIIENIRWALERGIRISVRVNCDRQNVDSIPLLEELFRIQGFTGHELFSHYLTPVVGNHVMSDSHVEANHFGKRALINEHQEAVKNCSSCKSSGDSTVEKSLPGSLVNSIAAAIRDSSRTVSMNPGYCGTSTNLQVLDPYGDVYACWDAAGYEEQRIAEYFPEFRAYNETMEHWRHRPERVMFDQCIDCAYVAYHGGGCMAQVYEKTGQYDLKDCEDYPWVFNESAKRALQEIKKAKLTYERHTVAAK